jgi:hypothetical protein
MPFNKFPSVSVTLTVTLLDSVFGSPVGGGVFVIGVVIGVDVGEVGAEVSIVLVTSGGVVSTPSGPMHPENRAINNKKLITAVYDFFRICFPVIVFEKSNIKIYLQQ